MSTGPLSEARNGLAAALAPLGNVFDVLPERFTPPGALLKPADPFVTTEGRPAWIGDMHYEVILVVRGGANPDQERAAFLLVERALAALRTHPHAVPETVSAPYDLQIGDRVHLAVRLNVSLPTRLTTD